MSATFLSVSHLAWSTPDGQAVFNDLNLDFGRERAGLVGRNGVGKSTLLRLVTRELDPATGTVLSLCTIGTLRQAVQVASDETVADLLGITAGVALVGRAQAGVATIDELAGGLDTRGPRGASARAARIGCSARHTVDPPVRLPTGACSAGGYDPRPAPFPAARRTHQQS